jgi:hypothetical protein
MTKPVLYIMAMAVAILLISAATIFQSDASGSIARAQGSNAQSPDATCPAGGQCFTDVDATNPFYTFVNRIYQQDIVSGYPCGGQGEPCDVQNRPYYRPDNFVNRQQMAKFIDNARHLPGIDIEGAFGSLTPIILRNDNGTVLEVHTNNGIGVHSVSNVNTGVYGIGGLLGVAGDSANGYGVSGESTGSGVGVRGLGNNGIAVQGTSTNNEGVHGETGSAHPGVYGVNSNANSNQAPGVRGDGRAGPGVYGFSTAGYGVFGQSHSNCCAGVYGNNTGMFGYGVQGVSGTGYGVDGESTTNNGVRGVSNTGYGVAGQSSVAGVYGGSTNGKGVSGESTNGWGVYGKVDNVGGGGFAGYFDGNVHVNGSCCSAGAGSFQIDDPQDPANKYLYHSAVASPDMMDIYNGNVTTGATGEAVVQLPAYFDALNRDFRYQLTPIGQFAQAIVWQEIQDGKFVIKTDKPNVKVSWQVTGIRQDSYANAHRTPVEQDKPAGQQGKYLYPPEQGQPESEAISGR